MQRFHLVPITLWGTVLMGRGQVQSLLSWDLAAVVTADSILSPAQSAGSACASEVEAVPSGATVGPDRHWGRQGMGEGKRRFQSCHSKGRLPPGDEGGEERKSL